MVAEAVTTLSAAVGILGSTIIGAVDPLQGPDEVFSSVVAVQECEKNLATLIALSKKHSDLLAKRPSDAASIEHTIETAWADLLVVKPVLERCGRNARGDKTSLRRRLRWKMVDQKKYHLLATSVSRNDADVRDHIKKLEQMVHLNPLEILAETAREEERRRRMEIEQARVRREINGLTLLDPLESPVKIQGSPEQASLLASEPEFPALLSTVLYPPYILPVRATPCQSVHSADFPAEAWSCDSKTPTSNRSIVTLATDSTLTGSAAPILNSLDGLIALGPDEIPLSMEPTATASPPQAQEDTTATATLPTGPVLPQRASG